MKKKKIYKVDDIIIYQTKDKRIHLEVNFDKETVWLNQKQMAGLFDIDRSVITKHLRNIFKSGELNEKSNVQKMHIAGVDKPIVFYNLDAIISLGYRINSVRATQFRIWATNVLKDHILKGYTINRQRLVKQAEEFKRLVETIDFLKNKAKLPELENKSSDVLDLLSNYANSLTLLYKYDKGTLEFRKGRKATKKLAYDESVRVVETVKSSLLKKKEASKLFGKEFQGKFEGIIHSLYQTFSNKELYPSIEQKAAHLLYFCIKDHPFVDGNKRIGSLLFVYFLEKNHYLHKKNGERKITDTTLASLALLVAMSDPKEKELMICLINNLLK